MKITAALIAVLALTGCAQAQPTTLSKADAISACVDDQSLYLTTMGDAELDALRTANAWCAPADHWQPYTEPGYTWVGR